MVYTTFSLSLSLSLYPFSYINLSTCAFGCCLNDHSLKYIHAYIHTYTHPQLDTQTDTEKGTQERPVHAWVSGACSYTPEYADQKKSSFRGHVVRATVRIVLAMLEGKQAGVRPLNIAEENTTAAPQQPQDPETPSSPAAPGVCWYVCACAMEGWDEETLFYTLARDE